MIGNQNSGKTTYMVSALKSLSKGVANLYIDTDELTRDWFNRLSDSISKGQYPNLTDKRSEYNFRLRYGARYILNFTLIDYNGGVIFDPDADNLQNDIENSQGIMIFLEAKALYENDSSIHNFAIILAHIHEYLVNSTSLFSVDIVLTKYDQIPQGLEIGEITKNIRGFLKAANNSHNVIVKVIPVSCTKQGFFNVELPLLDILDSGLRLQYDKAVQLAKDYYKTSQEYRNKTFLGFHTHTKLANKFYVKCNKCCEYFKSLENPIQNIGSYVMNYQIRYPNAPVANVSNLSTPKRTYTEL